MTSRLAGLAVVFLGSLGCGATPPPASQVPNAQAALDRLRATGECETAIQASAKIDHFGQGGRVRGDLLMFVQVPAQMRMDVVSPFGATILTLTSDGKKFSLADFKEKRFLEGPASACNIARMTSVPVPPHVLVDLLRGQAPVLKHEPGAAGLVWSPKGYYVVTLASTREASEEIHLAPRTEDLGKPWTDQRMRLLDVEVRQASAVLYHAELDGHAVAPMAKERVDALGLAPALPPSGPFCDAEIPKRIHLEVPVPNDDVVFRYDEITWNPPLPEGTFVQTAPAGMPVVPVDCP
jgi:outer membrane lipoprotein-sorting protein